MNSARTILINGVIWVGVVLVAWFLVWGRAADIKNLKGQIGLRQGAVELEREVIQKLNSINQVLDSQKSNVERLGQAIPTTEERPEIISMMEQLASQNGLNLKSIDITIPTETIRPAVSSPGGTQSRASQSLRRVEVDFRLTGSYGSLKSWLEAMEKNLRIMDVNNIAITAKAPVSPSGEVLPVVNPSLDLVVKATAYALER